LPAPGKVDLQSRMKAWVVSSAWSMSSQTSKWGDSVTPKRSLADAHL
jgi:hypothetical protein